MKHKKGFLQGDFIFYIAIIFALSIVIIVTYFAASSMNTAIQSDSSSPTEAKQLMSNTTSRFRGVFDWFIVTIVIGLFIAILLSAYLLRASPALVGISILLFLIITGLAIHFSNTFYGFSSSSGIAAYSSQFTVTTTIMNNLPKFILALLILYIVVLYAKKGGAPAI